MLKSNHFLGKFGTKPEDKDIFHFYAFLQEILLRWAILRTYGTHFS